MKDEKLILLVSKLREAVDEVYIYDSDFKEIYRALDELEEYTEEIK